MQGKFIWPHFLTFYFQINLLTSEFSYSHHFVSPIYQPPHLPFTPASFILNSFKSLHLHFSFISHVLYYLWMFFRWGCEIVDFHRPFLAPSFDLSLFFTPWLHLYIQVSSILDLLHPVFSLSTFILPIIFCANLLTCSPTTTQGEVPFSFPGFCPSSKLKNQNKRFETRIHIWKIPYGTVPFGPKFSQTTQFLQSIHLPIDFIMLFSFLAKSYSIV